MLFRVAIIVLTIFYITACMRDSNDIAHQTEMGMHGKHEPAASPDAGGVAAAPDSSTGGFNQQTQDYYAPQPTVQQDAPVAQQPQQQTPYPVQEMPSPEGQAQVPYGGAPNPAESTGPYPNEQAPRV